MAGIEYKPTMKKEELLRIAVEHGIEADDDMTKPQIIALLEAANAERTADGPETGPQDPAEDGGGTGEGNNTTHDENAVQSGAEGQQNTDSESGGSEREDKPDAAPQGYDLFVYAGPSLPRGQLKENTVFRGTFADVKTYLSDVLEDYPQIERLIVPANKLAAFSVKVKTPGNIAHKYYSDIVSAMRGNREV